MSQGLFTASTGIAANQARIDVIADNIANINTVGFKSSQINFETVFSRQLGAGSAPTDEVGGINPQEVGLGVAVGEIGRNFDNGSIQTTGRTTDLNIQGEGFFSLTNYDGKQFLTRAGNFSTDSNGFLVNPQGLKVVGTENATSTTSSTVSVQVPTKLNFVIPTAESTDTATNIGQESTSKITEGTFTMTVNGADDVTITLASGDTLANIATKIQTALNGAASSDGLNAVDFGTTTTGLFAINTTADTVTFGGSSSDTSNFLTVAGFAAGATVEYESAALVDHSQITINDYNDTGVDAENTHTVTTFSIANDGGVEATYSNGAKLTVTSNSTTGNRELKYVTASGTEITGASNITNNSDVVPAQLQLQLATVINPKGLNAVGGNLFALNSIAGSPTYGTGRSGGLGVINSGSLEASNVDMPREFANMILAQRGIEANSRTFEVQDRIMRTVVNLGR